MQKTKQTKNYKFQNFYDEAYNVKASNKFNNMFIFGIYTNIMIKKTVI